MNNTGHFIILELKLYYRTIIIKTACFNLNSMFGTKTDMKMNGTEYKTQK
jgi:hypothetical protein